MRLVSFLLLRFYLQSRLIFSFSALDIRTQTMGETTNVGREYTFFDLHRDVANVMI